jgi:hypothetical protein
MLYMYDRPFPRRNQLLTSNNPATCRNCSQKFILTGTPPEVTEDNYNEFAEGMFLQFPHKDGAANFYCRNCLPAVREAISESLPKCAVCGRPCLKQMAVRSRHNAQSFTHTDTVCSTTCLELKKAQEEEEMQRIKALAREFADANRPPDYPPLFTRRQDPNDPALILFLTTLSKKHQTEFLSQVLTRIQEQPWLPYFDHEAGVFRYGYAAMPPMLLHSCPYAGHSHTIATPLPLGIWDWIKERSDMELSARKRKPKQ